MSTAARSTTPVEIAALLARLRRGIRAYVWLEGLVALGLLVGLGFWISLAFDWVFEPPPWMRRVILAAASLAALAIVYRYILRRSFAPLADPSLALLVERRFREFDDALLTTVELTRSADRAAGFSPEMLSHSARQAAATAGRVELAKVFNTRPLARRGALAAALLTSVAAFGLLVPQAFGLWARRSLQFSAEIWPRRTRLVVEGFDRSPRRKVARGTDFDLAVRAEAGPQRLVPEVVQVRYEAADGAVGRDDMKRLGVAVPGVDDYQRYELTLKGVLASRSFHVLGGDDRRGPFHLDVVDSPTLARIALRCEYPAYQRRAAAEIPVTATVQLPRGTRVVLLARANKDLVQVQVDQAAAAGQPLTRKLELPQGSGSSRRDFQLALAPLLADSTLLFSLHDADDLRNREPIRLALTAVADEPPQVEVQLKGIGTAITPQARLPMAGTIRDDYGVRQAWFDVQVLEQPPTQHGFFDLSTQPDAPAAQSLDVQEAFEVEPLKLEAKQKLQISVRARDSFRLPEVSDPAGVGAGQRYLLEVVTPDQLRALLAARELTLRQRFEVIIEELTATRDSLSGVKLSGAPPASPESPAGGRVLDRAAEPGDRPAAPPKPASADAEPAVDARLVQLERVLQNSERSSHETLQVALAFDDIHEELVNNRVDTAELRARLQAGIAEPLKATVRNGYAELVKRARLLREKLADPAAAPAAKSAALAQADAVLVELKAVLDKMLELETFNEAVELLRSILADQEEVNQRTKDKQKEKLKELLK